MPWWTCFNCANLLLKAPQNSNDDIYILDFTHHSLHDVPPSVFIHERSLEELYLSSNRITELPRQLFYCHELKILYLNDNDLSQIPAAISSLVNLRKINMSRNSLTRLTDSIVACKSLTYLDLSVNNLEKLPNAITGLLQLEELYLNDTFLELLPSDLGKLSNLRILELRDNNLITLPKTMARLTKLRRLDIGNNEFTELPDIVGSLTALNELWCDGNRIRRIGSSVGELKELIHFDCSNNMLQFLPDEIGNWQRCQEICLSTNELEELPYSIGMMKSLVSLKIDENQLEELPDSICELENLEELMLSHNDLFKLPSTIGLLRRLRFLTADENLLRVLPNELCSCSSLTILSVRGNKLAKIPVDIGRLTKLRVLNLVNNFLTTLPVTILNLTNLSALWMSDNQSQPLMPLQKEFHKETQSYSLTCFLLPQINTANSTPTNAASTPTAQESVYDYYCASNKSDILIKPNESMYRSGNQLLTPMATNSFHANEATNKRRICFATDPPEEITFIGQQSRLMRSPTPYPKELRMMAKFANKNHNNQSQKYIHPKNLPNNLDKNHGDSHDSNTNPLNVHSISEYKQNNHEPADFYPMRQSNEQQTIPGYAHQLPNNHQIVYDQTNDNQHVNCSEALNTQIAGNPSFSSSYNKYNSGGNGLSISKIDGSHTFHTPHFPNASQLDSSNETGNTISKQDDVNNQILRNQMILDAQNHNISTHDSSNFSYSDTTDSPNNNTTTLQAQPQLQQPPPYHIAKAFTKKSKQDLLIYDIFRNQHAQDDQHSQSDTMNNKQPMDNAVDTNVFCDNTNANGNEMNNDNGSIEFDTIPNEPNTNSTAVQLKKQPNATMPWLFGKHENPTVIQLSIPKMSSDIGIQIASHNNQGIFVSSVDNQSAAHGIVRAMDKILDVNGIDFTKISLIDARNILTHCGSTMNIMVSRKK